MKNHLEALNNLKYEYKLKMDLAAVRVIEQRYKEVKDAWDSDDHGFKKWQRQKEQEEKRRELMAKLEVKKASSVDKNEKRR